jgi:hypothetical protein
METLEDQRAAEKRFEETRKQLRILIATFLKGVHELRRIEEGLTSEVEYTGEVNYSDWGGHYHLGTSDPFVSPDPSIQPLTVWPTEQQITNTIKEFKDALKARDAAFSDLSSKDGKLLEFFERHDKLGVFLGLMAVFLVVTAYILVTTWSGN